jgi:hypothetical protein
MQLTYYIPVYPLGFPQESTTCIGEYECMSEKLNISPNAHNSARNSCIAVVYYVVSLSLYYTIRIRHLLMPTTTD